MPKRVREGEGASKASSAKKRAVARYGEAAVAKYYSPRRSIRESGYVDLASANYALDTTGSITLIATVPQGTSVSQRIGKKISLKSLQIRGSCFQSSGAAMNDVAFLIVYDKRPTGSLPAITDVLVSANAIAFNNDNNSGRFVILKRVDMNLIGSGSTPATGREQQTIDAYVPLKGKMTVYKAAATGAIADIEEGALYLITVGSNVAGTSAATMQASFRTRYMDV